MTVRVTETRYGRQLYLDTDVYFAPLLEHCGEYSEGEVDLWRRFVRQGDTVVDVGAHVGCHTLALAQLVGSTGRVFAFEPQWLLFLALCGTVALNELASVHPNEIALGNVNARAGMWNFDYSQSNNYGGVSVAELGEDRRAITIATLDSFFELIDPFVNISFLKIDVEGFECEVLQGAAATIARCRPILYVENDRQQHSGRLIGIMQDMGYDLYRHHPPLWNQNNWKGHKDPIFPGIVSIMLLGMPKEREFKTDLIRVCEPVEG